MYNLEISIMSYLITIFRYVNLKAFVTPLSSQLDIFKIRFYQRSSKASNKRPILMGRLLLLHIPCEQIPFSLNGVLQRKKCYQNKGALRICQLYLKVTVYLIIYIRIIFYAYQNAIKLHSMS